MNDVTSYNLSSMFDIFAHEISVEVCNGVENSLNYALFHDLDSYVNDVVAREVSWKLRRERTENG